MVAEADVDDAGTIHKSVAVRNYLLSIKLEVIFKKVTKNILQNLFYFAK